MARRSDNLIQRYNGASQGFTTTGTTQASTAFGDHTTVLRIAATADTYWRVDGTPVATANDSILPAGCVDYVECRAGQKIAVLQVTAAGRFTVTEMTG